ncbi:type I polyketide synthase [Actinoalloteichus sp. AHMU CJ021]|uniref:type I polyketide synthase n=1 Tax=Actinoalloteichus cyanogriseus TaxID=2893586 RepID=UPI0004C11DC5|nr:type I polyketide synthase [Actinoalloteichus caeruleus]AUS81179.1 type I polyketide synthase [Actinoalloteichus sp. AHMU CJ021]
MSDGTEQVVEALRSSLIENDRLRKQNQRLRSAWTEPVAVVGMSCRYPGGAQSPEDLWRLVLDGTDAITPYPAGRGWETWFGGQDVTPHGGFLHDADLFDPSVFGISPREAVVMDPQQRLLLEASWEVFERAGIDPRSQRESRTGVYVGASPSGYSAATVGTGDSDGFVVTGTANSVLAGRISYCLGLVGPAMTIDTACSSSLVALHVAAQGLRRGECSLAIAGGVTVMANPAAFVEFGRQGGLAADGRCKSFAESADGTGWSEGVGLVLLERLSEARRNGHQVLAVIRGSSVNSDGASNGLTAPNGPSQRRVIRQALADAGLAPAEVDVVEAHGTGTSLGDPIEARALLATYGAERTEPLWLGSIKSNIGHTQAAAGVAGVIKMIQALRHAVLPRTLHVDSPSSTVDWSTGAVRLLTTQRDWPATSRPRRAAVSAFGMSGTNAHLVLEQAPEPAQPAHQPDTDPVVAGPAVPWLLSGRTPAALRAQANRLRSWVSDRPELAVEDVGWSLAHTRAALEHRAAVVAEDREALLSGLAAIAEGRPEPGVVAAAAGERGRPVFVFPGQGAQWSGMAAGLLARSPAFADELRACDRALAPWVDWSVTDVIGQVPGAPELDRVDVVQPALWAVMVSLSGLWRACGVEPAAVLGHSQGEIAAACVAGALSLSDGAQVVALRSRALLALAGQGGMVSLPEAEPRARERISPWSDRLGIAAVNGPRHVVVSGDSGAVDELLAACEAEGVRAKRIPVDYASHSHHVEGLRAEIVDSLSGITPTSSAVPFYSSVTGGRIDTVELDAAYWYRSLRSTVDFDGGARAALVDRHPRFVEVSPHPVLAMSLADIIEDVGSTATTHPTLRRGDDDTGRFTQSLAHAHVHGADVDWSGILAGARRVDLPTYAFRRQRFWSEQVALEAPPAAEEDATAGTALWAAVESGDPAAVTEELDVPSEEDDAVRRLLPHLAAYRDRDRRRARVDRYRHRIDWAPSLDVRPDQVTGTWLVVSPDTGDRVREVLRAHGAAVRATQPERVVDELAASDHLTGVVLVGGAVRDLVETLRALIESGTEVPLWCVTRGAVEAAPGDPAPGGEAALWGVGIVAALEHPDRWGGLVDVPVAPTPESDARLVSVLAEPNGEDQLAVRAQGVFARRLVPAALGARRASTSWRTTGTVLVTGDTATRGPSVARWLTERGAEHVVLLRRTTATTGQLAATVDVGAGPVPTGAPVTVLDVPADPGALLTRLRDQGHAVSGAVHLTTTSDPGSPLANTSGEVVDAAVREEVDLATALDVVLDAPETTFVVLTSTAATWGSGGFAAQAAAGASLDALIRRRRSRGLAGTALAGLPWEDGGERSTALRTQLERRGLRMPAPDAALDALGHALDNDDTSVAVADVDWDRFAASFTSVRQSPLLLDLVDPADAREERPARGDAGAEHAELTGRLAGATPAERHRVLLELVREHVAAVLGHPSADAVDPERAFLEQGFDSLTAVELRDGLRAAVGTALSATLLFDHPSPTALARHLTTLVTTDGDAEPVAEATAPVSDGILGALFQHSMTSGRPDTYSKLLLELATYRPTYRDPAELAGPPSIMRLAEGGTRPSLVCCCTVAMGSGFHEYARLAAGFRGDRDVYALQHPGFAPGQLMPDTFDVLIRTHVETVLDTLGPAPFVLAGHSAGAMMANSLAAALAERGRPPVALVLLDSYPVGSPVLAKWLPELFSGMAAPDGAYTPMDDHRITAWAGYIPLLDDWQAADIPVPTLLARADTPLGEWADDGSWRSSWEFPHSEIDVPGDHFSMLGTHAPQVASGIRHWLSERGW